MSDRVMSTCEQEIPTIAIKFELDARHQTCCSAEIKGF